MQQLYHISGYLKTFFRHIQSCCFLSMQRKEYKMKRLYNQYNYQDPHIQPSTSITVTSTTTNQNSILQAKRFHPKMKAEHTEKPNFKFNDKQKAQTQPQFVLLLLQRIERLQISGFSLPVKSTEEILCLLLQTYSSLGGSSYSRIRTNVSAKTGNASLVDIIVDTIK